MRFWFLMPVLFFSKAAVSQPEVNFHSITFTPPAGWEDSSTDLFRQYSRSNSSQNAYCIIMIFGASVSSGNSLNDFNEEWQSRVSLVSTTNEKLRPMTGISPTGISFAEGGMHVTMNDGTGRMYIHMIVLQLDDKRQTLLYFLGSKNMSKIFEQDLKTFFTGVAKIKSELTAPLSANEKVNPAIPEVTANNGTLYHGYQTTFLGSNAGNRPIYLYLFPDKTFNLGYFQRGYYNYNKAQEKESSPEFCGTYTQNGNAIALNFYKSEYHPEFTIDSKGNLRHGSEYTLFKLPPTNHLKLEATYTVEAWSGAKPTATFHLDGRFEDKALLCLGETIDSSMPIEIAVQRKEENKIPGNGSYRIVDNSIILHYDDGRWRQLLFYVVRMDASTSSPETIFIAGEAYAIAR